MEPKAKKKTQPSKKSPAKKPIPVESPDGEIFILAGEHSGDLLGGDLLRELRKKYPSTHFFGIGGKEMISQGNMESLEDMEKLSVIGFWEALKNYKFLKSLLEKMVEEISSRNCKYAILIDYPGFNLRLAERLQKIGVKVIFYVSPQIWAWKFKRIFHIRKNVDLMLTLFQFEEDLYREYGVNAWYVGHPLPLRIQDSLKEENPLPSVKDKNFDYTIGLLPGSRRQEIQNLLGTLLKTSSLIHNHFQNKKSKKNIRFLIPNINIHWEKYILERLQKFRKKNPTISIDYAFQASSQVMETSDILLLASGTATLEGVYWEKPMVILYKVSLFTYFLGSLLIKTAHIGLANILAGKEVCRELIQAECNPSNIARESILLLENKKYRQRIIGELEEIKKRELSITNGAKKAADKIGEFLRFSKENQSN